MSSFKCLKKTPKKRFTFKKCFCSKLRKPDIAERLLHRVSRDFHLEHCRPQLDIWQCSMPSNQHQSLAALVYKVALQDGTSRVKHEI